jgi:hypothetical protein
MKMSDGLRRSIQTIVRYLSMCLGSVLAVDMAMESMHNARLGFAATQWNGA